MHIFSIRPQTFERFSFNPMRRKIFLINVDDAERAKEDFQVDIAPLYGV